MEQRKHFVIALFMFGLSILAQAQEDAMASRVREELVRVQSYDRETFDRLAALGPEAVPELCRSLYTYEFPMVVVQVLSAIQDKRAVPALIEFLEKDESRRVRDYVVRALRELGDPRAEEALLKIEADQSNHISLRFEATAAIARLGSPAVRKRAWDDITEICRTHENVSHNSYPNSDVILTQDFYLGLCDVLTDEIDEELASFIRGGGESYHRRPVFELLGNREETRNRPKVIKALLYVSEHEYEKDIQGDELLTQRAAFEALLGVEAVPLETLLKVAETWEDAIAAQEAAFDDAEFVSENAEALRRLKAEVEMRISQNNASTGK